MILDEICRHKRTEVARCKELRPTGQLEALLHKLPRTRSLEERLRASPHLSLVAEVKAASPSRGILRQDINPSEIAIEYQENGAAAISVLTDERFFHGGLSHLSEVRRAVGLPLLRKDFIIDEYQLLEARVSGADAALLIAAILDEKELVRFLNTASRLGLGCMVEVHTEEELKKVLSTPATLIGINNRDLQTFKIDLETTLRLRPLIPGDKTVVSESGIKSRADVVRLEGAGVDAVLVGEALVQSEDIGKKIRELMGWEHEEAQPL